MDTSKVNGFVDGESLSAVYAKGHDETFVVADGKVLIFSPCLGAVDGWLRKLGTGAPEGHVFCIHGYADRSGLGVVNDAYCKAEASKP